MKRGAFSVRKPMSWKSNLQIVTPKTHSRKANTRSWFPHQAQGPIPSGGYVLSTSRSSSLVHAKKFWCKAFQRQAQVHVSRDHQPVGASPAAVMGRRKERIPREIALRFHSVCGGRKLRVSTIFTVRRGCFGFSCAQPVARNFHAGGRNSHKDTLMANSDVGR